MRPTQGVSFPRSGHAAVYHIVKRYFGDQFIYCDTNTNNAKHCGCGAVPCINPLRTYSKNHDFNVHTSSGVSIIPTEHYFIQYRSPVRSIISYFYLYLNNHPDKNTRVDWEKYAHDQMKYWIRFIDKWVLNFPANADPPLYCTYEALIANPEARVREILEFLSDGPLYEDAVARIIKRLPISPRSGLAEFKFYDPGFFRALEAAASEQLVQLNLPSFTEEL